MPRNLLTIIIITAAIIFASIAFLFSRMAGFGPPKPVEVTTPASVSSESYPEKDAVMITIDKKDKVYFTLFMNDDSFLTKFIKNLSAEKQLWLTDAQQENFKKISQVGQPFSKLKNFLGLPVEEAAALTQPGIPLDTSGGELADWIKIVKKSFAGKRLEYLIKGNNDVDYPTFKNVINALRANEEFRYQLVTSSDNVSGNLNKQGDPNEIHLNSPRKEPQDEKKYENIKTKLTLILFDGNRIYGYTGTDIANGKNYDYNNVRNVIGIRSSEFGKDFIVVIKPTKGASYQNTVDILDKMTISGVKKYAMVDLTAAEKKFLKLGNSE